MHACINACRPVYMYPCRICLYIHIHIVCLYFYIFLYISQNGIPLRDHTNDHFQSEIAGVDNSEPFPQSVPSVMQAVPQWELPRVGWLSPSCAIQPHPSMRQGAALSDQSQHLGSVALHFLRAVRQSTSRTHQLDGASFLGDRCIHECGWFDVCLQKVYLGVRIPPCTMEEPPIGLHIHTSPR